MKRAALILLALALLLCGVGQARAGIINVLQNPGFETGNFTSWTVGGNSTLTGVGTDGTLIPGSDPPFPPSQ